MSNIEKLPRQTPNRANELLVNAVESIDGELGEGYASQNPEVLAAFLNASSSDNSEIARGLAEINWTLDKIFRRYDDVADYD